MKILHTFPKNDNQYTYELVSALKRYDDLEIFKGPEAFWEKDQDFEIIHIHWPEGLFPKWQMNGEEDIIRLEETLNYWKRRSKIVVTRHNISSHRRRAEEYIMLYDLINNSADAVLHMGQVSVDEYQKRYPGNNQIHKIIPHPIYTTFPNNVSKIEARNRLGIDVNKFVLLAFGDIRTDEETDFLKNVFKALPNKNKLLLVPRWKYSDGKILKRLEYYFYKFHSKYRFGPNHLGKYLIPDEDVQLYFNAADVLLLPRLRSLNSGILILGYTFGKVVVGADTGVVGEILKATNNPIFDPDNTQSVIESIEKARSLSLGGKGSENRKFAEENWNAGKIADLHYQVYKQLTTN